MITRMKKTNNFQIEKGQPQGLLSFCLIFCQFQPDVSYKSVHVKRACIPSYIITSNLSIYSFLNNVEAFLIEKTSKKIYV